jgi:hypothetical protein
MQETFRAAEMVKLKSNKQVTMRFLNCQRRNPGAAINRKYRQPNREYRHRRLVAAIPWRENALDSFPPGWCPIHQFGMKAKINAPV